MNDIKTASILQRVPRILAVTAASYGLAQGAASNASRVLPATANAGAQHKPH
jgi:hypothetical protein